MAGNISGQATPSASAPPGDPKCATGIAGLDDECRARRARGRVDLMRRRLFFSGLVVALLALAALGLVLRVARVGAAA